MGKTDMLFLIAGAALLFGMSGGINTLLPAVASPQQTQTKNTPAVKTATAKTQIKGGSNPTNFGGYNEFTSVYEETKLGSKLVHPESIRTSSGGISSLSVSEVQKVQRESSLVTINGKPAVPIKQSDGSISWQAS